VPPVWQQPRWDNHDDKHRPPPGKVWAVLVRETTDSPAYYHPSISIEEQEKLELETVEQNEYGEYIRGNLIKETNSKRIFYRDVGYRVGASDGEETNYIFVEWARDGTVHGRPMGETGLRRKGIKL